MLAWYDARFGYVFEHFGPMRSLAGFIGGTTGAEIEALRADRSRFESRGQLGRYWAALPTLGG
jgi:hypothetical protein